MGAALSSLRRLIVEQPAPPQRCGVRLPEDETWAIATAWTRQLYATETAVTLMVDRSDSADHSIVDSFAWVRFDLPFVVNENAPYEVEKARHAASVARAAALTWHALSQCRGYSGSEHPTFWRRVFCHLQPKKRSVNGPIGHDKPASMRDAIGFFDDRRLAFPRFMLAMHGRVPTELIEATLETFCHGPLPWDDQATLSKLLSRLASFSDPTPSQRARICDLCVSLPASVVTRTTSTTIVQAINKHTENDTFPLRQLRLKGVVKFDTDEDVDLFCSFLNRLSVPLGPHVFSSNLGDVTTFGFAQAVRSILGVGTPQHLGHPTTSLSFLHDRVTEASVEALFSALPFATSIYSVVLCVRNDMKPIETHDLPWIAFAIFHPRASRSSWRHLELKDLTLTSNTRDVFAAMARGNNLLELLTGAEPIHDAYPSGLSSSHDSGCRNDRRAVELDELAYAAERTRT